MLCSLCRVVVIGHWLKIQRSPSMNELHLARAVFVRLDGGWSALLTSAVLIGRVAGFSETAVVCLVFASCLVSHVSVCADADTFLLVTHR
uniref:Secreted protein n=1 Tax=Steinernema glaseri TaxID=37863 RepID=A0A1I7ZMX5_9BILA